MTQTDEPEQPCILLVEDNQDHAELIGRALADQYPNVRLARAADGAEALAYLGAGGKATEGQRPDLILLDLRLPKTDGIEVLKIIKAAPETRAIPVVMLTSSTSEKDKVDAYDNYVNSYLLKPWDFSELHAMIRDIIEYWLDRNQCPVQERAGDEPT